ncbi:ATP-binding protein [Actinoplanes sp. M2I2]|uniref:ATP-binding protein n=1 Tax=Actinoplanes sp. M2I2 TaxID=1734444 RepID=UPI002020D8A2|nr:ATP-binding protein [Actinoplanes sp. M2I2]
MESLRLPFTDRTDLRSLRGGARQVLGQLQSPDLVEDVLLVITELVENVMQHTDDGGELVVRRRDDAVRIEVADSSPEPPRQYPPDPRRIGGRGMLLVAAMTREWGTHPLDGGKVVWADVPLSQ